MAINWNEKRIAKSEGWKILVLLKFYHGSILTWNSNIPV